MRIITNYVKGSAYLDLPATLLQQKVNENQIANVVPCSPPPLLYPELELIKKAANLLIHAKKPLVIIGKGKGIQFK